MGPTAAACYGTTACQDRRSIVGGITSAVRENRLLSIFKQVQLPVSTPTACLSVQQCSASHRYQEHGRGGAWGGAANGLPRTGEHGAKAAQHAFYDVRLQIDELGK